MRVYRGRSAYEYRPKDAKYMALYPLQRDADGILIETPAVRRAVLEAYEKATDVTAKDVSYWLSKFMASDRFARLSQTTQVDYKRYIEIKVDPAEPKSRNGIRAVFGKMLPKAVKPHHVRRYLDYWGKVGKYTTANRHLSCLLSFFGYCREHNTGVIHNPAKEIKPFPEQKRQYYITDTEYEKLLKAAMKREPYVAAFMEITYLCGLRRFEALQLNVEDIGAGGILIRRGKGSKGEITQISPRLQDALDLAISLHQEPEPIRDRPLLRSTRNDRLSSSAVSQAWRKVRKDAGLEHIRIHDLKKKAGTDGKDLGHRSERMKELYRVLPEIKKATR